MRWRRKQSDPAEDQQPEAAWLEPETVEFIPGAGACTVSRNVLTGDGHPRWMVREESKAPVDNGWVVLSSADTGEFLADPDNFAIVDFNRVCTIEPALIGIWDFPVGSDLELVVDGRRRFLVDTRAGREIPLEEHYVPGSPRRNP